MSVYKVPQDVEAEDKLIGPFSFRQFVYLIVAVLAIGLAWGLAQIFIGLAIIPLPIILLFGALALPIRKDQPMEVYLTAMISFYLKPRKRLWAPDGIESLIEITAPKTPEVERTKDLSQNEAERRFSYLANIVDSQGWAIRGPNVQAPNGAINSDVYFEAQQATDILDVDNPASQTLNYKLGQSDAHRHQEIIDLMRSQADTSSQSAPGVFNYFNGSPVEPTAEPEPDVDEKLEYNPYPKEILQSVLGRLEGPSAPITKPTPTTSEKVVSADIIKLANNTDFSIATIAHEASRINEKQKMDQEVVISLR